jgi:DNA-binding response OmpR family regulator
MARATILNISYDLMLLQTRSAMLLTAGHAVLPASSLSRALHWLRGCVADLVIIGHSLPPADTRVLLTAAKTSQIPVLLLAFPNEPFASEADLVLTATDGPYAFINGVDALLQRRMSADTAV